MEEEDLMKHVGLVKVHRLAHAFLKNGATKCSASRLDQHHIENHLWAKHLYEVVEMPWWIMNKKLGTSLKRAF